MRLTEPKVHLVARPFVHWSDMWTYCESVGAVDWYNRLLKAYEAENLSDGEIITEFMGRLCYRSWAPHLNPNVTKVREDSADYLLNILKSGHGSVLEHASYSFVFQDVSRVFTHELVRHRAGIAISQESLRYVRLTDIPFRIPKVLKKYETAIIGLVSAMEAFQNLVAGEENLDDMKSFATKKTLTSAMRRLAPLGLSTTIGWTANIRAIRHCLSMRTEPGAEEEIRSVFDQVGQIMLIECPNLFKDYVRDADGSWTTPYWKV